MRLQEDPNLSTSASCLQAMSGNGEGDELEEVLIGEQGEEAEGDGSPDEVGQTKCYLEEFRESAINN